MNKNELIEKFSEVLDVPREKRDFAFEIFLRELSSRLSGNQAIKIKGLGVFQIKREPVPREERKISGEKNEFLIYSPLIAEAKGEEQTAYLQIKIPDYNRDAFEYSDEIFSLSDGKPVAPIKRTEETGESPGNIDEKIIGLLNKSEIISDFDILNIVYSKEQVEKFGENKELVEESIEEVKEEEKQEQTTPDSTIEIVKEAEEELSEEKTEPEEIKETIENKEEEEPEAAESPVNIEEEETEESPEETTEEAAIENDPFKEVEETINEVAEEPTPVPDETLDDIIRTQEFKSEIKEEPENALKETEEQTEESERKKWIYYLAGLAVVVLVYFLFFTGGGSKKTTEKPGKVTPAKVKTSEPKKPVIVAKKESAKEIKPVNIKPKETVKIKKARKAAVSLYRAIKKERRITSTVFFDGKEYMVQVSSWRNPKLAEREVRRLRKKGLDAFIVKAYVKKFKRIFNRVRIGGFKSKKKAIEFSHGNIF